MLDSLFHSPTAIFFGKGTETRVGAEVAKHSRKALLHFGRRSFRKYGLHEKVVSSLRSAGVEYFELGGVMPNPRAGLVYEGIEVCRRNDIDFILAVGGGSVIDSAKAISVGVPWKGDFFRFYEGKDVPQAAIKVGTILTLPGSGSESNCSSVLTHEEKGVKLSCTTPLMAPVFSILNPELTYTLSGYDTACGIADAISHVLERYFTNTTYVDCTDRICEGLLKTLMKYAILVKDDPSNYDVRAEIMWASKLANDNTVGFGRKQDWATHSICHGVGAVYDVHHSALVSVIFPAWMKHVCRKHPERFTQLADRVFGIQTRAADDQETALSAIDAFRGFLKIAGLPSSLRELGLSDKSRFAEIAEICVRPMKSGTIGNFVRLSVQDIITILEAAY